MGYGDRWNSDYEHIYNAPNKEMLTSASGHTKTYALPNHPAFNDGNFYCRENIISDLKSIIRTFKPTEIFCTDYDCHVDHVACSQFFEEALLDILKCDNGYHPNVYKGYAYETAFFSDNDAFKLNLGSTINGKRTMYMNEFSNFSWDNRIRFPVPESATRFIKNSSTYRALELYKSQSAVDYAESIINSDKVFWKRRTDSILYNSKIFSDSGNVSCLNDFKIWNVNKIGGFIMSLKRGIIVPDSEQMPLDGIWIPQKNKSFTVNLNRSKDIDFVYLYENPSRKDNILNAEIEFDDGEKIKTGSLNSDGSATLIKIQKKNIKSFIFRITEWEGDNPGLTEIEAFEKEETQFQHFIKLTDSQDNFIYDYIVEKGENISLKLYTYKMPILNCDTYYIEWDNPKCNVKIIDETIGIYCPFGESCILKIKSKSGVEDSVKISNPTDRKLIKIAITFDKYIYKILRPHIQKKYYKNMIVYFLNEFVTLKNKFI